MQFYMRLAGLALCAIAALTPLASLAAATGYQATIKTTIQVNVGAYMSGAEIGPTSGSLRTVKQTLFGVAHWTDAKSAVELENTETGVTLISICDTGAGAMHKLDASTKTSLKVDIAKYGPGVLTLLGCDGSAMIANWRATEKQLKKLGAVQLKNKGAATINGQTCTYYSFIIDPAKVKNALHALPSNMQLLPVSEASEQDMVWMALNSMRDIRGKVWVSDKLDCAVELEVNFDYATITYKLNSIKSWTVDAAMLKIPKGYKQVSSTDVLRSCKASDKPIPAAPAKSKPKTGRRRP